MFFQQLFDATDGIDIAINVKRKNDKLTMSILPLTTSKVQPAIICGTPEELEAGFFEAIAAPLAQAKGLEVKTKEFEDSAAEAEKAAKEKADKAKQKASKEPAAKTAKKPAAAKETATEEAGEDGEDEVGEDAPEPVKKTEPKAEKKVEPKKEEKPKGPQPLSLF